MGTKQWKAWLLALTLLLWLSGYWFMRDGWWHRYVLWWTVLPAALLQLPALWQTVRTHRWLPLAGALLLYQITSRLWADSLATRAGSVSDTLAVALLLITLAHVTRHLASFPRLVAVTLTVVSSATALASVYAFYSFHSLADDRLKNVFVYESGLNPVLTGLLCACGSLCALSLVSEPAHLRRFWQTTVALQVFALLATQSRTAMVALGLGLVVLIAVERRKVMVFLLPVVIGGGAYLLLLLTTPEGSAAMRDLAERGSTGRFAIYQSFLAEMELRDVLVGKGMGARSSLPEEAVGWSVAHPHSSYLAQFYLTGILGTSLLLAVLLRAVLAALTLARREEPLWLALLLGSGLALAVDGSQVFSLSSVPRLEFLLLAAPAVIASSLALPARTARIPDRVPNPLPYDTPQDPDPHATRDPA